LSAGPFIVSIRGSKLLLEMVNEVEIILKCKVGERIAWNLRTECQNLAFDICVCFEGQGERICCCVTHGSCLTLIIPFSFARKV